MTLPRTFAGHPFPRVDDAALTCVGMRLDGDATAWIEAATPFTTPHERAHARRFVHAVDAARHLVGRALVRRMLAVDGDFPRTRWGKPVCPPEHATGGRDGDGARNVIDFSISHAGAMVWAAFCRAGRVGIDVEKTRAMTDRPELPDRPDSPGLPGLAGLADRGNRADQADQTTPGELTDVVAQLHPCERDAILALPPADRTAAFYRCWTRKEAVLKALGRGLSLPLNGFQVRTGSIGADWLVSLPCAHTQGQHGAWATLAERHAEVGVKETWTTRDIAAGPDHQCSVAACAPRLPVTVHLVGTDTA